MGSKRNRDVAWGFFYTSNIGNGRVLVSCKTKHIAKAYRDHCSKKYSPGPIFRITPPKPSAGKRGGRG